MNENDFFFKDCTNSIGTYHFRLRKIFRKYSDQTEDLHGIYCNPNIYTSYDVFNINDVKRKFKSEINKWLKLDVQGRSKKSIQR